MHRDRTAPEQQRPARRIGFFPIGPPSIPTRYRGRKGRRRWESDQRKRRRDKGKNSRIRRLGIRGRW